jgi:hypothetical protein
MVRGQARMVRDVAEARACVRDEAGAGARAWWRRWPSEREGERGRRRGRARQGRGELGSGRFYRGERERESRGGRGRWPIMAAAVTSIDGGRGSGWERKGRRWRFRERGGEGSGAAERARTVRPGASAGAHDGMGSRMGAAGRRGRGWVGPSRLWERGGGVATGPIWAESADSARVSKKIFFITHKNRNKYFLNTSKNHNNYTKIISN